MDEIKDVKRKVYIEIIEYKSRIDNTIRKCAVLKVDLGYCYKNFSAKSQSDYAEILDVKTSELYNLPVGTKIYIN